jgi:hypothetical protein
LAECGHLPSWLVDAIKVIIRPIILQGMVSNKEIDLVGLRASFLEDPGSDAVIIITCFDKE